MKKRVIEIKKENEAALAEIEAIELTPQEIAEAKKKASALTEKVIKAGPKKNQNEKIFEIDARELFGGEKPTFEQMAGALTATMIKIKNRLAKLGLSENIPIDYRIDRNWVAHNGSYIWTLSVFVKITETQEAFLERVEALRQQDEFKFAHEVQKIKKAKYKVVKVKKKAAMDALKWLQENQPGSLAKLDSGLL